MTNPTNGTTTDGGGRVTWQAPMPEQVNAPKAAYEPFKVNDGSTSWTASGGSRDNNQSSFQVQPFTSYSGSVAATISNIYGQPSCELPGLGRTNVATAVTMGYLVETAPGVFVDTGKK